MSEAAASHDEELSVEEAFGRLYDALKSRGAEFAKVGGDVAFYVKDAKPPFWQVSSLAGNVVVKPGAPPFPVCTIGLSPPVLSWLVQGTLDVQKNFKYRRLAVEGDLTALALFVKCFAVEDESA
ncbi:MAG: SCP2 sterol-binding domain-containing protein [Myxococcaceae bacterium]|nr:SCP2 sterol-binding domain-containing protein [Myxococcaceae bacterium]